MDYTIELIMFVIILLIVTSKPHGLMDLGNSLLGRAMMLALIVVLSLKSSIGGLLGALLFVILSESITEGMDNEGSSDKKESDKEESDKEESDKEESDKEESDKKDHSKKNDKKKDHHHKKEDDSKTKDKNGFKGMKGADLVGLSEKFSQLRSLADAVNKSM